MAAQGGVWMGAPAELPTAVLTCTRAASPCRGTVKLLWVVSAAGRVMAGADWYGCGAVAGAGGVGIGCRGRSLVNRPGRGGGCLGQHIIQHFGDRAPGLPRQRDRTAGITEAAAQCRGSVRKQRGPPVRRAQLRGRGVPSGAASAAICAARSAGERTIVSPCTRPVISSCGSSTGIGSGSSSTGMRGVSNLGSCGTGVSGVSNSVGCGRSSVVSALTSCGV